MSERILGTAKVSSKHQICLPKSIRPFLDNIKAGESVVFKLLPSRNMREWVLVVEKEKP